MDTDERGFLDSLTERVLGAGFLEKVYERALARELKTLLFGAESYVWRAARA